jgi:hypothetical protein
MPRTVRDQMPDEERAKKLLFGLRRTLNDKVIVNISHLAQAVGSIQEANKLAESLSGTTEIGAFASSRRSTLRNTVQRAGICQVDRLATVEAIEKKFPALKDEDYNAMRLQQGVARIPMAPTPPQRQTVRSQGDGMHTGRVKQEATPDKK